VRAGLAAWGDAPALLPVPRPGASVSAGDALRHGILFLALGIVAVNLGGVLFALIDHRFPDPLATTPHGTDMRWSVAGLAVAWPVWASLSLSLERRAEADPGRRRSAVGRWLTTLALFIAAATVIGDPAEGSAYRIEHPAPNVTRACADFERPEAVEPTWPTFDPTTGCLARTLPET